MKKVLFLGLAIFFQSILFAQDSLPPHLEGKIIYPAIDLHPFMGVFKIENTVLKYDSTLDYKVAIDVYDKVSDSTKINGALSETARTYNLLIANGVPQEKLKMAVVVHWLAVYAILNNEAYEKKYGIKNPNIDVIRALKDLGVNFYVCAQNLGFFDIPSSDLTPEIEVAISAKTTFITLDQMGYSYLNVNED